MEAVSSSGEIPADWEDSFNPNLYKGNYRGLQLTYQVMKLLEWVLDFYIRKMLNIDKMQFGFAPGRGTTDAIFIVLQLQEKYIAAKNLLYFDLAKAFYFIMYQGISWGGSWWTSVSCGSTPDRPHLSF